jgi:tetratricopeptide (TPR) repeat protein
MSYYLRAARRMSQIGATVASIAQLERAAALAEFTSADSDLTMEIREQLGDLLHVAARYADARCQFALASAGLGQSLHRARLCRKIARTRTGERDFRQAAECLEDARDMLHAALERGPDWSREWVQVSLDRMGMLYWTTDWNTIGQLRLEIGAELDLHGTPAQRRQFRFSLLGMLLRRDRLVVSDEMIALARENLESAVEEGSATAVAVTRFQLAYVLLWSEEPALAEDHLLEALALAERTADRTLACRCLTYLSVLYRKLLLPQRTREYAARALEAATELGNREYTGVSFANQAWLSWKRESFGEALERGRAALAEWSDRPVGGVPFAAQWLALWPLLASSLATGSDRDRVPDAIEFARGLLDHDQARLPDEITSCLADAMAAYGEADKLRAERHLVRATGLARRRGYL